MDREGNFSIDDCISECMQNRIGEYSFDTCMHGRKKYKILVNW